MNIMHGEHRSVGLPGYRRGAVARDRLGLVIDDVSRSFACTWRVMIWAHNSNLKTANWSDIKQENCALHAMNADFYICSEFPMTSNNSVRQEPAERQTTEVNRGPVHTSQKDSSQKHDITNRQHIASHATK